MDIKICTQLLEDVIEVEPAHRVALCFADSASFAYHLAESVSTVDVFERSHGALNKLQRSLDGRAENITFHRQPFPIVGADYDTALMLTPKSTEFTHAMLWRAASALKPDGTLYIAGETKRGAKTVIALMGEVFGSAHTAIYKSRHRVGVAYRPPALIRPDWLAEDGDTIRPTTYVMPDGELTVYTQPGVFSWDALDDGTRYLLEHFDFGQITPEMSVLDVGCGVGVLGLIASRQAGAVTLVDDDLLAVNCARATLEHHGVENAEAFASDVYSDLDGRRFDLIVSNPPFHKTFNVNTNVAHRIIRGARDHLNDGGRLVLVANAFLNYQEVVGEHFRSVSVSNVEGKFQVIEARL